MEENNPASATSEISTSSPEISSVEPIDNQNQETKPKQKLKLSLAIIIGIITFFFLLVGSVVYFSFLSQPKTEKATVNKTRTNNINTSTGSFYKDVANRLQAQLK